MAEKKGKRADAAAIIEQMGEWKAPLLPDEIPHGDMPGDKVQIDETHVKKAGVIFPELLRGLLTYFKENPYQRAVVTVCGGSGVGKSEIASLLSYYLNEAGIGSYTLSGDNYPYRIPQYNDAERLRVFRSGALQGMLKDGTYSRERFDIIHEFSLKGSDADKEHAKEYDWYSSYLEGGRAALKNYLGTKKEIGFDELTEIIREFKGGKDEIFLKRMGRTDTELWYDSVDFSEVNVLVIEWTHGNSDNYEGVDFPVLLNSTPQETLAHRRARNRDGATDSPFTMLVLELEQDMLESQAHKAKIIVSKSGEILDYDAYQKLMEEAKKQA